MGTRGNKPASAPAPPSGWEPIPYPRGLNAAEREYWDEFMSHPSSHMLDGNDTPVLRALCEAMVMHDKIRNDMKNAPLVVQGNGQTIKAHPLTDVAYKLRTQIQRLTYSLGFSPTSRRGAQAPQRPVKTDPDAEFRDSL